MEQVNNYSAGRPILGFAEAVKICFRKYFDFTGRARRSEYWWFSLFISIVSAVCSFLDGLLSVAVNYEIVGTVATVLLFFPALAVGFRRLHDIGRSGWWLGAIYILAAISVICVLFMTGFDFSLLMKQNHDQLHQVLTGSQKLIALLPLIAGMVLCVIIFFFKLQDSHSEENKYGPSPKYQ